MSNLYRVGRHQPQNIYRGDEYIGVMFSPVDADQVVRALNGTEHVDQPEFRDADGDWWTLREHGLYQLQLNATDPDSGLSIPSIIAQYGAYRGA